MAALASWNGADYNGRTKMNDRPATALMDIVAVTRGHFRLESGHHAALWLDLDSLFADAHRIDPFVSILAKAIEPYNVTSVCGPLLGGAFLAQLIARELGTEFCFTERVMPAEQRALYPARYRLPPSYAERLSGKRIAVVDDVMSAGSALKGTCAELEARGAQPVVVGALLVLGRVGADFFHERKIPVEAAARSEFEIWLPGECPLCAAGMPVEDVATPTA